MLTKQEIEAGRIADRFGDVQHMRNICPALFSTEAHPRMSDRYAFTHTYDIVDALQKKDYKVVSIQGGDTRFSKLLVRMRHRQYIESPSIQADGAPELIIMDSHDGTKALKLALGYMRFVCMNGCIAGDLLYNRVFRHASRDLMAQVMLEVNDIGTYVNTLTHSVDAMRNYRTTIGDRIHLADVVTNARFGSDRGETFKLNMRPKLLHRRRHEDTAEDLHTVVNVIQENAIRGGLQYCTDTHSARGRMIRSKPVNEVNKSVAINTQLWNEATVIMQKAA
jgi:Domain of unknown function (DUF932).